MQSPMHSQMSANTEVDLPSAGVQQTGLTVRAVQRPGGVGKAALYNGNYLWNKCMQKRAAADSLSSPTGSIKRNKAAKHCSTMVGMVGDDVG